MLIAALLPGSFSAAGPADGLVTVPCALLPAFVEIGSASLARVEGEIVPKAYDQSGSRS